MTNNEQEMLNDEGWNRFALSFSIKLAPPAASGWAEPWTSKHMLFSQNAEANQQINKSTNQPINELTST